MSSQNWGRESEVAQLVVPPSNERGSIFGHDLVGSGLGPRPAVPGPAQLRTGFLAGMLGTPRGFVAVDVARDLRRSTAEGTDVRRQLADVSVLSERVAVSRERGSELGVAPDGGMPDAIECLDAVDDADRVESAPAAIGEDAGVDLEVEVQVTGTRGVVTYDGAVDLLDRDLDLPPSRADPRHRVAGEPVDDLGGSAVLRGVVGRRDVGVHRSDE
jgi:hypothetical protein